MIAGYCQNIVSDTFEQASSGLIKIFVRFIEIMRGQLSLGKSRGKYFFPTQTAEKVLSKYTSYQEGN